MLKQLRRQQLRDLATAYNIRLSDPDAPKEKLISELVVAEQNGVFRGQPVRPEYLVKASRSPDDGPVDWEPHAPPKLDLGNRQHLLRLAKEHGLMHKDGPLNFGASNEDIKAALEERELI